ncbi:hypothetical protein [Hafnia sp. HMSC23F03]|uniref:GapS6a family protein n=1 Tax=Hafnia sp. HMSC23F03 TaxID=1581059 RepID=UPI0008A54600|nr:hypothetical protein [Hafnia sp. HMSC23F03]OFS11082.1 hypothetical protein HMPREF3091_07335 [Hafnia sp. HMSC23F03]
MDFISSTILSGLLYDGLKVGVVISTNYIKESLKNWLIDDKTAQIVAEKVAQLGINDDLSESAIKNRIESDPELIAILSHIKATPQTIINNSTHNGTGDIIHGNKTINN